MQRRRFLEMLGVGTAASLGIGAFAPERALAAPLEMGVYGGARLDDWTTVVGDGIWAPDGAAPVDDADIETASLDDASELRANVHRRAVMAHNITYKPFVEPAAIDHVHVCSYEFRLPYLPSTAGGAENAQTVEGGLFVWDGVTTRRDHGLAFQWVLNPWMSSFGAIRTWSGTDGGRWVAAGQLEPDTEWHTVNFALDMRNRSAVLSIDDTTIPVAYSETPKPSSWSSDIAARLQAEIVSLWPGEGEDGPSHRAQVRNWSWAWMPHPSTDPVTADAAPVGSEPAAVAPAPAPEPTRAADDADGSIVRGPRSTTAWTFR